MTNERFIKPTEDQLIKMAILFNGGKYERKKIVDMLAFSMCLVDRLCDNGDIMKPSSNEL